MTGALAQTRGFSLIECLVSVLIIAIGFLGAARMQTFSLGLDISSQWRTQAMFLVSAMGERVRANASGYNADAYSSLTSNSTASANCEQSKANCSASQIAAYDYANWVTDVQKLPKGVGYVCLAKTPTNEPGTADCDSDASVGTSADVLMVKVCWDEKKPIGTTCFFAPLRP